MNIRKATLEDSASLAKTQVDSYRTTYAGILPSAYLAHFTYTEQTQDWRDLLTDAEWTDTLLVAETEVGELAGYALVRPGLSDIPPYDSELVALHVGQAWQGQGAGRQLVTAAAKELKQRGCRSMMLWVLAQNPARALYEYLGAKQIGQKEWAGNEEFGTTIQEAAYGWLNLDVLTSTNG